MKTTGKARTVAITSGGKNVYGVPVGILMLDTRFPRIPGDIGNAATWPFPVSFRIVQGADVAEIVRDLTTTRWLQPFIDAALELQEMGVSTITTSCGFLALFQPEIQRQVRVPFLSSSLLQIPWLLTLLPPDKRVGVMTIEKDALTDNHFRAAGIADRQRLDVIGMDEVDGYFNRQILGNQLELDVERAADEHEAAAQLLLERHPDVGAIVLECTNMPPYADRIRAATSLPVYDITTLVRWAVSGL